MKATKFYEEIKILKKSNHEARLSLSKTMRNNSNAFDMSSSMRGDPIATDKKEIEETDSDSDESKKAKKQCTHGIEVRSDLEE